MPHAWTRTGARYDPANYPELNGGAGLYSDLSGNELPNSPRWTANLGAEYTIPFDGDWAKRRSPIMQLAATCALEHFTAILANAALSDPTHLDGADDEARRMWRWHAIEEIEHKSVAFDTWNHVTRAMPNGKRWLLRSLAMASAAVRFHYVVFRNTADLLAQDEKNDWRTWLKLLRYLYRDPGLMRALAGQTLRYLRPDFHPWQHDDRELAARALVELTPSFKSLLPK